MSTPQMMMWEGSGRDDNHVTKPPAKDDGDKKADDTTEEKPATEEKKEETPAPTEEKKTDAAPVAGGDAAAATPAPAVEKAEDALTPMLKDWKSKTALGLFSSREPQLGALDRLFAQLNSNSSLTAEARQAELQKARTLLEEWKTAMEKKTANSKWVDHPRNKKANYFTKLDELLPKA